MNCYSIKNTGYQKNLKFLKDSKEKSQLQIKIFIFSKHFLKHLGLIFLFYLIVVFSTILYLNISTNHGQKIAVPNLVGLSASEAKKKLEDLGLKYAIIEKVRTSINIINDTSNDNDVNANKSTSITTTTIPSYLDIFCDIAAQLATPSATVGATISDK